MTTVENGDAGRLNLVRWVVEGSLGRGDWIAVKTVGYVADQLKQVLATYTESGGQGSPIIDTGREVAVLLEKYEVCCGLRHGFDW